MIYIAYEITSKIQAGLILVGQNAYGQLEWKGTNDQWALAERLMDAYRYES